jgi:hypothetical protein
MRAFHGASRFAIIATAVLAMSQFGCGKLFDKKSGPPPAPPLAQLSIVTEASRVTVGGVEYAFGCSDKSVYGVHAQPRAGATVELNGTVVQPTSQPSGGNLYALPPMALSDVALIRGKDELLWAPKVHVKITQPEALPAEFDGPPVALQVCLLDLLLEVKSGPVLVPGEPATVPAKAPRDRIVYSHMSPFGFVGNVPKSLSQIDWIVDEDDEDQPPLKCTLQNSKSGEDREFELPRKNQRVTIYDRRTGKKIDTKLFVNQAKCPTGITVRGYAPGTDDKEDIERQVIETWLQARVRR